MKKYNIEKRIYEYAEKDVPNNKEIIKARFLTETHPKKAFSHTFRKLSFSFSFLFVFFLIATISLSPPIETHADSFTLVGSGEIQVFLNEDNEIIEVVGLDEEGVAFLRNNQSVNLDDLIDKFKNHSNSNGKETQIRFNGENQRLPDHASDILDQVEERRNNPNNRGKRP